ncbi:MAG TPA: 50S ribosomal protein L11 methyltransferase [Thermoanaerobaculia bacterium]|nr:50S ribosomal protein L11 methyltransferase [Thermoanaerobaculia bacterium]
MRVYLVLVFRVPADLDDLFAAALWEAGTLGCEQREDGTLAAWFDQEPPGLVAAWGERGVAILGRETVVEQDWLAAYRAAVVPFELGAGFFVDPREPDLPAFEPPPGRRLLRLPARTAFGIGSHESTRLAFELLEGADLEAKSVLDVGTGTGILVFAALALGAARAVAFDLDVEAACAARQNLDLNAGLLAGRRPMLFAGAIDALAPEARFDLVVANVLPGEIAESLATLAAHLAPDGEWILSGLLIEQEGALLAALAGLGFAPHRRAEAAEWAGLTFRRTGATPP